MRRIVTLVPEALDMFILKEYAIAKDVENLYLVVTNIRGDEVYKRPLNYVQDQLIVPAEQLPTGQYFCTIQANDVVLKTEKFILTR